MNKLSFLSAVFRWRPGSRPIEGDANYLRGKLEGIPFECAAPIHASSPVLDDYLSINAGWTTGALSIEIFSFTGVGEYPVSSSTRIIGWLPVMLYAGANLLGDPVLGSGKVIIEEITGAYVKGKFECVLAGTGGVKTINSGEFRVGRDM